MKKVNHIRKGKKAKLEDCVDITEGRKIIFDVKGSEAFFCLSKTTFISDDLKTIKLLLKRRSTGDVFPVEVMRGIRFYYVDDKKRIQHYKTHGFGNKACYAKRSFNLRKRR